MAGKSTPWSNDEVHTLLCFMADDRIQSELDGATRNEKVYVGVSEQMASRTSRQCREKIKKLKTDYRAIKDHHGLSGSKDWKWFEQMDAIYGNRPTTNAREGALDPLREIVADTGECFLTF